MPPKKKPVAKKTEPKQKRITVIRTEEVALSELQVYHKNPRIGNVDKIAKSLHLNGLYRAIVVNIGTHTGRTNEILAGNHTYLGARKPLYWQSGKDADGDPIVFDKPAWDTILCSFVDVDDQHAAQIVIADNKTAEDGSYDESVLVDLIESLPQLVVDATGYDTKEFHDLIGTLDDVDLEDIELDDDWDAPSKEPKKPNFDEAAFGDEDDAEPEIRKPVREKEEEVKEAERVGIDITKVSTDRPGAMQLSDEPIFADYVLSANGNQYVRLIPEKLMTLDDLPKDINNLQTWAGSATKDDTNPERVWFYNFGVDSTSGMDPEVLEQMIVAFFTWDEYFEGWWQTPSKFVNKVLNTGVRHICTPDLTPTSDMGNVFLHWQLFRSRYLGRYFQEAGLKLIPHLIWPDGDMKFLQEETLPTLPDEVPLLLMQAQTIDPKRVEGGMDHYKAQLQVAIDHIKPEGILLYTGKPGRKIFEEELNLHGAKLIVLEHRQGILNAAQKPRKLKKTL